MPNTETMLEHLQTLGTLLQNEHLDLLLDARELTQPVGAQGFQPRHEQVRGPATTLNVLGQSLLLEPEAEGDVQIHAADAEVDDLFVQGETFKAPEGTALAALGLYGKLRLGSNIPVLSQGMLNLTFTGSAEARFGYQHLLPVWQGDDRVKAFKELALSSRLPSQLHLDQLRPGEVHRLDAKVNLTLGVRAQWGQQFDLEEVVELWRGLSAGIRGHAAAELQASLGWSMYEEMQLTVGRANLLHPGWVRVRLQRRQGKRLTLGSVVELQATYDGNDIATILRQTLDQSPLPRLLEVFRPLAAGDWDRVKGLLTERATATLDEYLDDTGWQQWLAERPEVQELVEGARRVVDAYDGLDERIQSWWDRVLGEVDLGPDSEARRVLETVAGIGDGSLEELIENPDVRKALDWIEVLSGKSLEELVLGSSDEVEAAVGRAAELARQALDFLDQLPHTVLSRIETYADKLGVLPTLDWLRQHAGSKEALLAAADAAAEKRLRQLVERLMDRAWERLTDSDLATVQAWAQRLTDHYDRLDARFKRALEKFKGELGFSLSVTLDRMSQREALLDIEVDPTDPRLNTEVSRALGRGSVRDLLDALPPLVQEEQSARYLLREAVLSEKRVRTSTLSVLFRFLGLNSRLRNQSQWSEEAQLSVKPHPEGLARTGTYSGGFRRANSDVQDTEASVWFETEVDDIAQHPSAPFAEQALRHSVRLTYGFQDPETTLEERAALDRLLAKLGFMKSAGSLDNVSRQLADTPVLDVRLALELRIGAAGVEALFADLQSPDAEAGWNHDYLRAAQHWFRSPVLAVSRFDSVRGLPLGEILESLTYHHEFESTWRQGRTELTTNWLPGGKKVEAAGQTVIVKPLNVEFRHKSALLQHWRPEYNALYFLASNRGPGLKSFQALREQFDAVGAQRTPAALLSYGRRAAAALRDVHPGYSGLNLNWNCPTFLTWLILSRLFRLRRQSLKEIRGFATLRWRAPGADAWSEPLRWVLDGGVPSL